jgi:hypothetical protein
VLHFQPVCIRIDDSIYVIYYSTFICLIRGSSLANICDRQHQGIFFKNSDVLWTCLPTNDNFFSKPQIMQDLEIETKISFFMHYNKKRQNASLSFLKSKFFCQQANRQKKFLFLLIVKRKRILGESKRPSYFFFTLMRNPWMKNSNVKK